MRDNAPAERIFFLFFVRSFQLELCQGTNDVLSGVQVSRRRF